MITVANGTIPLFVGGDGINDYNILEDFKNLKPLNCYNPSTKLERALCMTANLYNVKYIFLIKQIVQENLIDAVIERLSLCLNDKDKKVYQDVANIVKNKIIKMC